MPLTQLQKILDKLNDIPNISENEIFTELVNTNSCATFKLNAYALANMWNNTDAVKYNFATPKTAADFMEQL